MNNLNRIMEVEYIAINHLTRGKSDFTCVLLYSKVWRILNSLCYFWFVTYDVTHVMAICAIWRLSFKRKKLLTLCGLMGSSPVFDGGPCFFQILAYFVVLCFCVLFLFDLCLVYPMLPGLCIVHSCQTQPRRTFSFFLSFSILIFV